MISTRLTSGLAPTAGPDVKTYRPLNELLGFRDHYWGVSNFLDTEWLLSTLFDASL
jgi:hypothetical protein